jgi:hypothetical protein
MPRVFIIHRWSGGSQDDWRPWLKQELIKLGYEVIVPSMPETDEPKIDTWVNYLTKLVKQPDQKTYFIGHSIGCQTILRYLETINTKIGGAIFVSGWFNLINLEDEDTEKIAEPWLKTPIDLEKVKANLNKSVLIISDNDPFDCFMENQQKFTELGSNIVVLTQAGHITKEDGFTELPIVVEKFKELI